MTANFSQTQSAKVGDQVLPMAIGLQAPAALRGSEIRQRYGDIVGLGISAIAFQFIAFIAMYVMALLAVILIVDVLQTQVSGFVCRLAALPNQPFLRVFIAWMR